MYRILCRNLLRELKDTVGIQVNVFIHYSLGVRKIVKINELKINNDKEDNKE